MRNKIPRLIDRLGPEPFHLIDELRLYGKVCEAYQSGARSLHKAHRIINDRDEMSREKLRSAMVKTEALFGRYFKAEVDLFDKPGDGMGWVGLTDHGIRALALTNEFLSWCDQRAES